MSEYTKLPADLPEDWAPSQVVTPGGAEAGLPERYGYNYLMRQVNEAQRMCNALREELERKANTGSPQLFGLELDEGVENYTHNYYFKDLFGIVTICASLRKKVGSFENYDLIGQLPQGFRPQRQIDIPAVNGAGDTMKSTVVRIHANGKIDIGPDSQYRVIYFQTTFPVAQ